MIAERLASRLWRLICVLHVRSGFFREFLTRKNTQRISAFEIFVELVLCGLRGCLLQRPAGGEMIPQAFDRDLLVAVL